MKNRWLKEICENCGFTYGSHLATGNAAFPASCCPGHEGAMDWDEGPGTVFKSTGTYKEEKKAM